MAFGRYSPVSTPVPQLMVDNQLFSHQQIPVSPQYYPQQVGSSMPHMYAAIHVPHIDMTPKGHMNVNVSHNHGFYNMHGMFGSGEHLSSPSNTADGWRSLASTPGYTKSAGALGSFDPTIGQPLVRFRWRAALLRLNGEFITTVQQCGAAIIKASKLSSALSAVSCACNHIRDWVLGTPEVSKMKAVA